MKWKRFFTSKPVKIIEICCVFVIVIVAYNFYSNVTRNRTNGRDKITDLLLKKLYFTEFSARNFSLTNYSLLNNERNSKIQLTKNFTLKNLVQTKLTLADRPATRSMARSHKLFSQNSTIGSLSTKQNFYTSLSKIQDIPFPVVRYSNKSNNVAINRISSNNFDEDFFNGFNSTTCSKEASLLGFHQKIISYSFFGNSSRYYIGIPRILKSAKKLYPNWFVRIYTDSAGILFLKTKLGFLPSHAFLCNVASLPPPLGDISDTFAPVWRFAPIGDPQVDVVIVRDTDSKLKSRESAAVAEWLEKSTKTMHLMRDHPQHVVVIMAGMFGIRSSPKKRRLLESLRNKLLIKAKKKMTKQGDQDLLREVFWYNLSSDVYCHDSYMCLVFWGCHPFPTKRENFTFVGSPDFVESARVQKTCPFLCRPKQHRDWKFC